MSDQRNHPIANLSSPACRGVKFGYNTNYDVQQCTGNFFIETDHVIHHRNYTEYLRKHEVRKDMQDMTLVVENFLNRIARSIRSFIGAN